MLENKDQPKAPVIENNSREDSAAPNVGGAPDNNSSQPSNP